MNKKTTNINYLQFVEDHAYDVDISYRGGGFKIVVADLIDTKDEPAVMGAYQNYLGGGVAGSIQVGTMFDPRALGKRDARRFEKLSEACKQYFFNLNNGGGDEYMQENYGTLEFNQSLPESAY